MHIIVFIKNNNTQIQCVPKFLTNCVMKFNLVKKPSDNNIIDNFIDTTIISINIVSIRCIKTKLQKKKKVPNLLKLMISKSISKHNEISKSISDEI